ncbi:MAG TPA: hypothetical protein VJZ26_01470 [Blastocatellia bacterium]|nr:hypothetical protein [Blastocatellia bacterium]
MSFNQANKRAERANAEGGGRGSKRRVYSVPVWMEHRTFAGSFDLAGASYKLAFVASRAEILDRQLRLTGKLTVTDPQSRARSVDSVRATLDAIQGGVGSAPLRRQAVAAGAQTGNMATAQQKQQAAGENEKRSGEKAEEPARSQTGALPRTECTGPTSFCGVMYFHLDPLNGRTLGVAADLSRVQLNARLAPRDADAKSLHSLYTALVDAVYGEQANEAEAAIIVEELNKLLRG